MKSIFTLLIIIFTTIILTTSTTFSQESGGNAIRMTLNDCFQVALEQNFDIKLTESQIDAASARVLSAYGNYIPSIGANIGYNRQLSNISPGTTIEFNGIPIEIGATQPNSYNSSIYASYTIFDGFAREANLNMSRDYFKSVELNSEQTIESVLLEVYRNYITVIKNEQIVKIREENLELGRKELERINEMYKAGIEPIGTVYSQEADLGQRELDQVTSENTLNISKAKLLSTLGLEPNLNVKFEESSLPSNFTEKQMLDFRADVGSIESSIKEAFDNRKDLLASDFSIESAESNVTMSRSGYLPRITAAGGWSWSNKELKDFSEQGISNIRFSLSMPIFDQFNTNNAIQNANLQLEQTRLEQMRLKHAIKSSVRTAYLNLDATEKQIEITGRSLKSAERNYESASERFKAGASSITELNFANTQYVTAQINRIQSVYNYFQAQKELLYTKGKLQQ